MSKEIFVIPAFGQGHLLPSLELCKHLASRNFNITLIIFPNISSSIPISFRQHPLIQVSEIQSPPKPNNSHPFHRMEDNKNQLALSIDSLLSSATQNPPVCAILDALLIINWTSHVFNKFQIPTVAFFTSGAASSAMEYATWKANPIGDLDLDLCFLPGLPQHMALTSSDLKRRSAGAPRKMGPPDPGEKHSWVDEVKDSVAIMINTCDDLERPFIDYISKEIGKPAWGIGPLLPEKYWESTDSVIRDGEIRSNQRQSNTSEDEVIEWLDGKPEKSVLYISFGSELCPTVEEYGELAEALENWVGYFIWVIQPGSGKPGPREEEYVYFPEELDKKVKRSARGMIIKGWAPQLMILSHRSTGGFISHCGWNSSVEAIGRGVPVLGWPIRGDQFYNAKLIVSDIKIGYMVSDDMSKMIKKEDIIKGVNLVMGDEDVRKKGADVRSKFEHGFPLASSLAFDAFKDFINLTPA
ncbi:anthocyanin 3'-O-beta-glucosyltransferase-like [Euphorbia lathyris]|uniref:anthocyanin 3'-O-beta-glucosyltransferase-like n=1 Tax=Euphorbia lathyris TaxID=212925 RepID=UPI00331426AF